MPKKLTLGAAGLQIAPSPLSAAPRSGALVANNVLVNRAGLYTPRFGWRQVQRLPAGRQAEAMVVTPSDVPHVLLDNGDVFSWFGTGLGDTTASGSALPPQQSGASAQAPRAGMTLVRDEAVYTTARGLLRTDSGNPAVVLGAPRPLDAVDLSESATAPAWLAADASVAYRFVLGRREPWGQLVLSAPSNRVTLTCGAAAKSVQVSVRIPVEARGGDYFLQVYRSAQTPAGVSPSDDMGQVYEVTIAAGQADVTFTDICPDDSRGANLYTNPRQEGILQANTPPPRARLLATFRNCLFAAGVDYLHRHAYTLLGNLAAGDTVTVYGTVTTVFTAIAAGGTPANDQQFAVGGTGSPAVDVEITVRNLARAINRTCHPTGASAQAGPKLQAYVLAEGEDGLSRLVLERTRHDYDLFWIQSSAASKFSPQPGVVSTGETVLNRVHFSKPQQHGAWPATNYLDVGDASYPIDAWGVAGDSLFLFKTDGLYRLTGDGPDTFRVECLDPSLRLVSWRTLASLGNALYGATVRGFVRVTEAGVEDLDSPVDVGYLRLGDGGRSVCDPRRGLYMVYQELPDNDDPAVFTPLTWVYNVDSDTWTNSQVRIGVGAHGPWGTAYNCENGRLFGSDQDVRWPHVDSAVYKVTAVSAPRGLTLESAGSGRVPVGSYLAYYDNAGAISSLGRVAAASGTSLTLESDEPSLSVMLNQDITFLVRPRCAVRWVPQDGGDPTTLKTWGELKLVFSDSYVDGGWFGSATLGSEFGTPLASDGSGSIPAGRYTNLAETVNGLRSVVLGFYRGVFTPGEVGLQAVAAQGHSPYVYRTVVPATQRQSSRMTVAASWDGSAALAGLSLEYDDPTERVSR